MPVKIPTSYTSGITPDMFSKIESFDSSVYTFSYKQEKLGKFKLSGSRRRRASGATGDPSPMILNVRRGGRRLFTAKNGKKYMAGINLNYVTSPVVRDMILRRFGIKRTVVYNDVKMIAKFTRGVDVYDLYRVYDWTKAKNQEVVDMATYLEDNPPVDISDKR